MCLCFVRSPLSSLVSSLLSLLSPLSSLLSRVSAIFCTNSNKHYTSLVFSLLAPLFVFGFPYPWPLCASLLLSPPLSSLLSFPSPPLSSLLSPHSSLLSPLSSLLSPLSSLLSPNATSPPSRKMQRSTAQGTMRVMFLCKVALGQCAWGEG